MTKFAANQANGAKSFSATSTKVPRIGELLVAANIIKPGVLNESLQIAKTSRTLIGRTLISLGQLDEHKLQVALDIQTLIRERTVNTQSGIQALSLACNSRISANDALQKLGLHVQEETNTHKNSFAQLIIDSGLVTAQVLASAEQQSIENNLPLGRCLVVNRYTTQNRLESLLSAQSLIRENQITQEQALKALKLSIVNREPIEHFLIQFGVQQLGESDKRVLDLLSLAGFISPTGKLTALEIGLTEERACFDILTETEMVGRDVIDKALTLQVQILAGNLTLKYAAKLLKKSHTEGLDLQTFLAQMAGKGKYVNQIEQIIDLLLDIGILAEQNITASNEIATATGRNLGDVLLEQNDINTAHLDSAWQAQRMIDDKMISFEYACKALRKLVGTDKEYQTNTQEELQQITQPALSAFAPETWLTRITKKLFNK